MQMQKTLAIEVRVLPKELSRASLRALERVSEYDWILFTSKNTVSFFTKELRRRKIHVSKNVRIAAVGPETAAALRAAGFSVDALPERFTARDMVRTLGAVNGLRILFPRSAIAAQESVQILRARGARVQVIPLYYPVPVPISQATKRALVAGSFSKLLCKSPSGMQGFLKQLNASEKRAAFQIPIECIGPTTAKAVKEAGFRHVSQTVL